MKHRLAWFALFAFGSFLQFTAFAQTPAYPSKAVKIIVPTSAGGPTDVLARIVGKELSEAWRQPVVIENRPGADSIIGTNAVAKAPPDGYTLLMAVDAALTVHPFVYKKLPYDPFKELAPITSVANSYLLLYAHQALRVDSLADLLKLAKAAPEKYSYGWGTMKSRLIAERLSSMAGVKFMNVQYKGSAPNSQALLAGDINLSFDGLTAYKGNLGTGRFKLLAVTGERRTPALPKVPTFAELGFPGFNTGVWLGLLAPAGTPAAIINKVRDDVVRVLALKEVANRLEGIGLEPFPSTPQRFAEMMRSDAEMFGAVVRAIGFTID